MATKRSREDLNTSGDNGVADKPSSKIVVKVCSMTDQSEDGKDKVQCIEYEELKVVGSGSFGVVSQVKLAGRDGLHAIKRVMQDRRYKNRELKIMKTLSHPNVVKGEYYFYTSVQKEVYLNLVLEFVPDTISRACRQCARNKEVLPPILVKLYVYQLFRALKYIHSLGVCHRDIKPQNLLVDQKSGVLKLCDFGSAKVLVKGEPNVAYICSRYYRAPELLFGANEYTTAIDIWSSGCVMGEMLLEHPLFPGSSGVDQLVEIIKALGTPTAKEIYCMNPSYNESGFPKIKPRPWSKVFQGDHIKEDTISFLSQLLRYSPESRLTADQVIRSDFFNELCYKDLKLPAGVTSQQLPNDVQTSLRETHASFFE